MSARRCAGRRIVIVPPLVHVRLGVEPPRAGDCPKCGREHVPLRNIKPFVEGAYTADLAEHERKSP